MNAQAVLSGRSYLARVKAGMGRKPYADMSIEEKDAAFGCSDERAASYAPPIAMADGPMPVPSTTITEESIDTLVAALVTRYGIDAVRTAVGAPAPIIVHRASSSSVKRSTRKTTPAGRPDYCASGASCYVGALSDALSLCVKSTGRDNVNACVMVEALPDGEGFVRLSTTDGRTSIVQCVPARHATSVRFVVDCRNLLDSLKGAARDDTFRVCPEEIPQRMDAYIGDRSVSYCGRMVESFPTITAPADITATIRTDAAQLAEVIGSIGRIFKGSGRAMGYDKILVECIDREIRMVATDTVRLLYSRPLPETIGTKGIKVEAMLPADGARILAAAGEDMAEVSMGFAEDCMFAELAHGRIVVRLCDREFPAYREILEGCDDAKHSAVFTADDMRAAIKGVAHVAKDTKHKAYFGFCGDRIKVSAQSHDGKASSEVACSGAPHDKLELAFNGAFVTDALPKTGAVVWRMTSPIHPSTIEHSNGDTWLIMPINV